MKSIVSNNICGVVICELPGFRGAVPLGEGVVDKPTKRRESALLAGAIRGATWLGSEGKAFPYS